MSSSISSPFAQIARAGLANAQAKGIFDLQEELFPTGGASSHQSRPRIICLDAVREVGDAGTASLLVHPGLCPQSGDLDQRVL